MYAALTRESGVQVATDPPGFRGGRKVMRTTVNRVLCWFESSPLSNLFRRGVRCTGGLINRFAPDQSTGRVRLPAPEPVLSGRLQRLRGLSYKQVLQGSTPWPATILGR